MPYGKRKRKRKASRKGKVVTLSAHQARTKAYDSRIEKVMARVARHEDDKQITWKIYRESCGALGIGGGLGGYARFRPALNAQNTQDSVFDFINGYWSGNSAQSWQYLSRTPKAYHLLDIEKMKTLQVGQTNQQAMVAMVSGPLGTFRPRQERLLDIIKIKSIVLYLDLNFPCKPPDATVGQRSLSGATTNQTLGLYVNPAAAPAIDQRGTITCIFKLIRCTGTERAPNYEFAIPESAAHMGNCRPPGWRSLLDKPLSGEDRSFAVSVLEERTVRFRIKNVSQRKQFRMTWRPKYPREYQYAHDSDTFLHVKEGAYEQYFLHMATDSPEPALQVSPNQSDIKPRVRVVQICNFRDAQA